MSSGSGQYNGQAEQDKFILKVLKEKRSGWFVEIGSNDPIKINNTYLLEKEYGWKGLLVEMSKSYLPSYKRERPASIPVIQDATKIDYKALFTEHKLPANLDYLQVDLEVSNGSTLETLKKLDAEVFDSYTFATVTFEHDVYREAAFPVTRTNSRAIFERRGYVRVFSDIHNKDPAYVFEDWYVHPSLVDMVVVEALIAANAANYVDNPITGKSIDWQAIKYE